MMRQSVSDLRPPPRASESGSGWSFFVCCAPAEDDNFKPEIAEDTF